MKGGSFGGRSLSSPCVGGYESGSGGVDMVSEGSKNSAEKG